MDKLLAVPGIGKRTVCGFIAEVGDIRRFDSPKQLQKLWLDYPIESSSASTKGKRTSATEVGNGSDMCYTKQRCQL